MPEYARICQNMPEYARICQNMPEYARICQNMPTAYRQLTGTLRLYGVDISYYYPEWEILILIETLFIQWENQ